jgi:hypothetical protein
LDSLFNTIPSSGPIQKKTLAMNSWLTFGLLAVAAVASPVEGGSTPTSALSSNSHGTKAPKVTLSPQIKAATAQSENSNSDSETLWYGISNLSDWKS